MTALVVKEGVTYRQEPVNIPTYQPCEPDVNPMFIEKRVYQGSSGRVYPLPFYDRIAESSRPCDWDGVWLENKYIKVLILPQIGGRIHIGQDKTNGYHFFYRQQVIKPALVGLAGPWISGGVEFNWPQHHRPSTFMPVDLHLEEHPDGSKTVWLSEHEPMNRMKGMHGVCLHPDKNYIHLKVRLYNRTQSVQTFLWWANVATRVHDQYQSFFPPDVHYVADHAKRAMSEFPECRGLYYGVDYRPGTRLDWYKNIPVPTSYMCMGTQDDFFGGYDHGQQAGVVHVANHHISPGKKQWTWGNHEFGYAWDRNLTDQDGPYIELMAGVYTDNQPDFSFLHPGETRTFNQYWYPIREIGPACHANLHGAASLSLGSGRCKIGVAVTGEHPNAEILVTRKGELLLQKQVNLSPGAPFSTEVQLPEGSDPSELKLRVCSADGATLLQYTHKVLPKVDVPAPATEPPSPAEITSTDELYITGLHLDQYRHATRDPQLYWKEALRRDPGDCRCNNAMGLWHFKRGEWEQAEQYFRSAVGRLTLRNPNPFDGEAYYNLGMCLRYMDKLEESYAALYKATWNYAWQSPSFYVLAQIDCSKQDWPAAMDHLDRALRVNTEFLQARNLRAIVLDRMAGQQAAPHHTSGPANSTANGQQYNGHAASSLALKSAAAQSYVASTRELDPLDWWSRCLAGDKVICDNHTLLDVALDYAAAGMYREAVGLLQMARRDVRDGTVPLVSYYSGYFYSKLCDDVAMKRALEQAAAADHAYCFPARLQEIHILQHAVHNNKKDARARYYLGNLLYDRRRYEEAISMWEEAAEIDPTFSIVWRNLGIAYFNVQQLPSRARESYDKAVQCVPQDARILFERDQLWKRLAEAPQERLSHLLPSMQLCLKRDDLAAEVCALHLQLGEYGKALDIVSSRKWQPWEGGEGQVLDIHVRSHLSLGREALSSGNAAKAVFHFGSALNAPHQLGEAKHMLANYSHVYYWLGKGFHAAGDQEAAEKAWTTASQFQGDFQSMAVCPYSEMTLFSALALKELGRQEDAQQLLGKVMEYAQQLETSEAKIDYFATSLPTMLLFHDDLSARQGIKATFLKAQAEWGLGHATESLELLHDVLRQDPSHAMAADLKAEIQIA